MTLIAINVLLLPDAATAEKAVHTNARLLNNYPAGFALDANHAPHITLLQQFVRRADLAAVANAVAAALGSEEIITSTPRASAAGSAQTRPPAARTTTWCGRR